MLKITLRSGETIDVKFDETSVLGVDGFQVTDVESVAIVPGDPSPPAAPPVEAVFEVPPAATAPPVPPAQEAAAASPPVAAGPAAEVETPAEDAGETGQEPAA